MRSVIAMLLGLGALTGCDDSGEGTYARGLSVMADDGDGEGDVVDREPLRPRPLPDPPLAGDGDDDADRDGVVGPSPRPGVDDDVAGDEREGEADADAGTRDGDVDRDEGGAAGDEDAAVPDTGS